MKKSSLFVSILAVLGLLAAGAAILSFAFAPATKHAAPPAASVSEPQQNEGSESVESSAPMVQADYVGFDKLTSLADEADVIAKGKVVAERTQRLNLSEGADREANPTYVDCVVVDFKVQRSIKGPIQKSQTISIAYLSGEDVPGLKNNASSLVFLATTEAGPYMPLNPAQAVIRVENGKLKADNGGSLVKDGDDEEAVLGQLIK